MHETMLFELYAIEVLKNNNRLDHYLLLLSNADLRYYPRYQFSSLIIKEGIIMTAIVQSVSQSRFQFLSIAFAAFLGLSIIYLGGHAQSQMLHEAAHDVRHATGFPCH
jgi:cobalt transporter subunit CbtB